MLAAAPASMRGLNARFMVYNALELVSLGEQFDTVLDSGLFHVFDDDDRARFVHALHNVVVPGGRYHLLCFSDLQSGDWGPRRVTKDEIRTSFSDGWRVESIDSASFDINLEPGRALAWRSAITRS
jgi:cyclopropane fatty-acyl-phospholipid synthase-like methyltransferase